MHKIVYDLTPFYLKNIIPPIRRTLYGHRKNTFHEFRCHSSAFKNSFFPHSVNCWNNIGSEFTSLASISVFKNALLALIRPPKKSVFCIRHIVGIHNLFQLRLGLSDLKYHKKSHNFLDTPSDMCACNEGAEDLIHFFCKCPLFDTERAVLVDTVSLILANQGLIIDNIEMRELVKIYLYGDFKFSALDNRLIILAAIEFITKSNRFVKDI